MSQYNQKKGCLKISEKLTQQILEDNTAYTKYVTDPELRSAMDTILLKYSDTEKFHEAEKIARVMIAMFTKQKAMTDQFVSGAVQPLTAAAYLSNVLLDNSMLTSSLFLPRDFFTPIMKEKGVMDSWIELIFQTAEGQLGADTPVPACTPHGDHPINIFAWARWFVKECPPI